MTKYKEYGPAIGLAYGKVMNYYIYGLRSCLSEDCFARGHSWEVDPCKFEEMLCMGTDGKTMMWKCVPTHVVIEIWRAEITEVEKALGVVNTHRNREI